MISNLISLKYVSICLIQYTLLDSEPRTTRVDVDFNNRLLNITFDKEVCIY